MNDPLHRARLLMNVSRYEEAERSLRQALAAQSSDAEAHALLSLCLLEQEKFAEGTEEAQTAVGLAPDVGYVHYVLARAWSQRNYRDKSLAAIDEAIRLAPHDADYHAFRAGLMFEASRWRDALASAETALAIDPEHVGANNLRAMALVKLGRRAEAGQTIDATLARDPEDAWSHANKGWTLLEQRQTQEAIKHFREALRLEPSLEYARRGIVEALKAKNPIYGLFLRYALAMAKLPPRWQFGVIVGGWFGNRVLRGLAKTYPAIEPFLLPIIVLYVAFALLTWLARPVFNLLLRLHPLGKHALSRNEKIETNFIGGCFAVALLCFALSFLGGPFGDLVLLGFFSLGLTMPLFLVFQAERGWPRQALIAVSVALAALAVGATSLRIGGASEHAQTPATLYFYLWIATIWGGQLIAGATPKR